MFRVLERATGPMAIAPAATTTGSRPATAPTGRVEIPIGTSAEPVMLAPWGESAEPFPWVVVSTRVWTDAWPGMPRKEPGSDAIVRALARPAEVARIAVMPRPAESMNSAGHTAPTAVASSTPPTITSPATQAVAAGAHAQISVVTRAMAFDPVPIPRREHRARRGILARVAVLAIGLLVSLLAVEAVTRVGRR